MSERFVTQLEWTGALRGPTRDPATFSRDLDVSFDGIMVPLSSAPGYRGDPSRANPEQLLVAALSACQALTYLFLAAKHKIAVVSYSDAAEGQLGLVDGKIRMSTVTLRPQITLEAGADEDQARALVAKAHSSCFIANSVATPVEILPTVMCAECVAAVP
jgi:organic hydroperoxide reductase OsmC/OhrA